MVKYTLELPVESTLTPSGGKGNIHTQTLVKEFISLIYARYKAILFEISSVDNWLPLQYNRNKAVLFVTANPGYSEPLIPL